MALQYPNWAKHSFILLKTPNSLLKEVNMATHVTLQVFLMI